MLLIAGPSPRPPNGGLSIGSAEPPVAINKNISSLRPQRLRGGNIYFKKLN
jgi:hypothetical protein